MAFTKLWALEKVHGTSAHIGWFARIVDGRPSGELRFFPGGESHDRFVALFDQAALKTSFEVLGHSEVTVYGEAYGGRQQGMSATYGKELRFIAFDVKVGDHWLSVPDAAAVVAKLGLEFVPYKEVLCTLEALDAERDAPSEVAIRRGISEPKPREGIVIRPPFECTTSWGRLIAKHKRAEFGERATPQKVVDPSRLKVLEDAQAVADEWVVDERLNHVVDKFEAERLRVVDMLDTGEIIKRMIADVYREAAGEIVESREVQAAIGKRTAQLFKERITKIGGASRSPHSWPGTSATE